MLSKTTPKTRAQATARSDRVELFAGRESVSCATVRERGSVTVVIDITICLVYSYLGVQHN